MCIVLELADVVDPGTGVVQELGDIERCRPERCPRCGARGRDEAGRVTMQGHGGYRRQVLGQPGGRRLLVWIRRFLCVLCRHTQSILASWIHPWRWYRVDRIVEAVYRSEIGKKPVKDLQEELTGVFCERREKGWRTLTRWKQDFLEKRSLFGWLGSARVATLGVGARLGRLLFGQRPDGPAALGDWSVEAVRDAARAALAGTCHPADAYGT